MTNEEFIKSITLDGEEWRDIQGWEGYYLVSSFGRVASLKRVVTLKNGKPYNVQPRLLRPNATTHNGIKYNSICFRKNGNRYVYAIHRLVAIHFIPNHNDYPEVDHIDRDGQNNRVTNLRWCNRLLNMQNENTKIAVLEGQRRRRRHESLVNQ